MSKELFTTSTTGTVVYAQVINPINGTFFRTDFSGFEAYTTANLAHYAVAMTEASASGMYFGNFTGSTPPNTGRYKVIFRHRVGGSPAESDPIVGSTQDLSWDANVTAMMPDLVVVGGWNNGSVTTTVRLDDISETSLLVTTESFYDADNDVVVPVKTDTTFILGSLSPAAVTSVWNALISGMTTLGSIGKKFADWALGTDHKALVSTDSVTPVNVTQINSSITAAVHQQVAADLIFIGFVTGAASTTTLVDTTLTQADTDQWKGRTIIFTSGSLKYEASNITGFNSTTHQLTFATLSRSPSTSDAYIII